jgi:hypothetical protein
MENSAWTASDYTQTNRQTSYPAGRLHYQQLSGRHYQPTDTLTAALSIRVFTYQYKTNSKYNNYKASITTRLLGRNLANYKTTSSQNTNLRIQSLKQQDNFKTTSTPKKQHTSFCQGPRLPNCKTRTTSTTSQMSKPTMSQCAKFAKMTCLAAIQHLLTDVLKDNMHGKPWQLVCYKLNITKMVTFACLKISNMIPEGQQPMW